MCGSVRDMREPATLEHYRRSHEIALAQLDAAMAQDVVGGGGLEIEIRQTEVQQKRLPFELALAARKLDNDLLVLGAVDLQRLEALDDRLRYPAPLRHRDRQARFHGNAGSALG